MHLQIKIIFVIFILYFPKRYIFFTTTEDPYRTKCYSQDIRFPPPNTGIGEQIRCVLLGYGNRPLHEILGQQSYKGFHRQSPFTFAEVAPTVESLKLDAIIGNITILENSLSQMPKLERMTINVCDFCDQNELDIAPTAFRNTLNLTELHLSNLNFSDDAIRALESLKNQLTILSIDNFEPQDKILKAIEKLTKLEKLSFSGLPGKPSIPVSLLKKLTTTLKSIKIRFYNLQTIKSDMFDGRFNLTLLKLSDMNISTIEPGAFKDLRSVHYLNLASNEIKILPDGLFKNMTGLMEVVFTGKTNTPKNLSRYNFTHCPDFRKLRLGEEQ